MEYLAVRALKATFCGANLALAASFFSAYYSCRPFFQPGAKREFATAATISVTGFFLVWLVLVVVVNVFCYCLETKFRAQLPRTAAGWILVFGAIVFSFAPGTWLGVIPVIVALIAAGLLQLLLVLIKHLF